MGILRGAQDVARSGRQLTEICIKHRIAFPASSDMHAGGCFTESRSSRGRASSYGTANSNFANTYGACTKQPGTCSSSGCYSEPKGKAEHVVPATVSGSARLMDLCGVQTMCSV